MTSKEKRRQTMMDKYGGEDGYRTFMREISKASGRNSAGTGGFAKMAKDDPERLSIISQKAGKKSAERRWNKE